MIYRVTYHAGGQETELLSTEIYTGAGWEEVTSDNLQVVQDHKCDCIVCQTQGKVIKEVKGVWHKNVLSEKG